MEEKVRKLLPIPEPDTETLARFWGNVEVGEPDQCWPWIGWINPEGYGRFVWRRTGWTVHRIAYRWTKGPIPEGLVLDHLCRNRACVNPDHLEPVTDAVNTLRSSSHVALNAVKTHCHRGHPFTPENTLVTSSGRSCMQCDRIHGARWRAKQRVAVEAQQLSCEGRRHVFARYGHVGSSGPFCRRCGGANPRYDARRDPILGGA